MTTLHADPSARRQVGPTPLWIFWRDAPSRNGREAFVAIVHACHNPDCTCTEVRLQGFVVDERLRSASVAGDELTMQFATPTATAATPHGEPDPTGSQHLARLDFAQRTVAATEEGLAEWLRGEFDDELAAVLRDASERAKRERPAARDPWENWQPGDLVPYRVGFPPGDFPPLDPADAAWRLEDLHCVEPSCDCTDVRLVAMRSTTNGDEVAYAGSFVVTLPSTAAHDVETDDEGTATRNELLALWRRTCERHPDLTKRLAARRTRMKSLRPPRRTAAPLRALPKTGRNDPCPCGSGKKWKKCCGA